MNISEQASYYSPLTSPTRVKDFEIQPILAIGGKLLKLPKSILAKDVHYIVDAQGNIIRAAWISPTLAHLLNSQRLTSEARVNELIRARQSVDNLISSLIKERILRDRKGPGAMAFCQANEAVPKDSICLSSRTFDALCAHNPKWKNVSTVIAIRFPNLGPETTRRLKVIVNKTLSPDLLLESLPPTSLAQRVNNLNKLLELFDFEEESILQEGVLDCFYVHPETLKNSFEGDGDGDQLFILLDRKDGPIFKELNLTRIPDKIDSSLVDILFEKASRVSRTNLSTWLSNYFDDTPIGPATYAIRFTLNQRLPRYSGHKHPMQAAWKDFSPEAIVKMETIFDIRKGEHNDKKLSSTLDWITKVNMDIKRAQNHGCWFSRTVTSSTIQNIPEFISTFTKLQNFVNNITGTK